MPVGVQLGAEPIIRLGDDVLAREPAARTVFLAEASRALAACDTEESVLRRLVDLAVPALADWCAVDALEDDGCVRRLAVGSADPDPERTRLIDARSRAHGSSRTGPAEAIRTGRAVLLAEAPGDLAGASPAAEYLAHLLDLGFQSAIVAPLAGRRRTMRALTVLVSTHGGRRYREEDLFLVDAFVSIAALALDAVRLVRAEQDSRRAAEDAADRMGRLQAVTAALSQALTPERVADAIFREGLGALGADRALIYLVAEDGTLELLREMGHEPGFELGRERMIVSLQHPIGVAQNEGEAVFLSSPEAIAARFPSVVDAARAAGTRALAALPLIAHGRTLGVLGIGFRSPHAFDDRDRALATSLASQCAQALERSRLFVAERRARGDAVAAQRRLALLDDASALLASSLDPESALVDLARLAVPAFADWLGVYLVRGERCLECAVSFGRPGREEVARRIQAVVPRDPEGSIAAAVERGESRLVAEIDPRQMEALVTDPDERRLCRELEARSAVVAPVEARGRVIGALVAVSNDPGRRYGSGDLSLLEDLGRRVGLALDNARLFHEARAAVRARDEFLSVASHELRTPLSALSLNLQALLRSAHVVRQPGAEQKLHAAERQAQRISRLIERLLDVSRITAGRLDLQREEVDLSVVVRDVVARAREELARAGCTVLLSAAESVVGLWDRLRVDQIATNLLSNAMKYGRAKPIEIATSLEAGRGRLSVRDHGIGIDPEHRARIFERFERAVPGRHYGGLGLGLWIVRQIVEAHGGTIAVESEPGRGSTFTVELPVE